jgi:hypothetical protein
MIDLQIASVETLPVALPTLADFAVSGGSIARAGAPSVRVLVKVTGSDGTVGWGEATPIPSWTYETLESIATTIARYLAPVAIGIPVWDLDRLTRAFDRAINRGFSIGAPLAKAAVDVAVHDLLGHAPLRAHRAGVDRLDRRRRRRRRIGRRGPCPRLPRVQGEDRSARRARRRAHRRTRARRRG